MNNDHDAGLLDRGVVLMRPDLGNPLGHVRRGGGLDTQHLSLFQAEDVNEPEQIVLPPGE